MIPINAYLQSKINSALILFHLNFSIHKIEKDFVKSVSAIFVENRNIWKYTSQNCAWGNTVIEYQLLDIVNFSKILRIILGTKYSRMNQVKFVEGSLQKKIEGISYHRSYHFKFFKGCLPQISLGPFLNTLSHLYTSNNANNSNNTLSHLYISNDTKFVVKSSGSFWPAEALWGPPQTFKMQSFATMVKRLKSRWQLLQSCLS